MDVDSGYGEGPGSITKIVSGAPIGSTTIRTPETLLTGFVALNRNDTVGHPLVKENSKQLETSLWAAGSAV
jgi:hypothetical protein